ncbi:MAG TPA: hypothetical protein VJ488_00830, partial [Dehalococcoidia bacterium]|nr:hypothetical protein [Dehalococcoidia bacterium]
MVPSFGPVGTTATISITSTSFPIGGDYQVRWSPTANFEMDNSFTVISEGTNPRDVYSIVVSFTV